MSKATKAWALRVRHYDNEGVYRPIQDRTLCVYLNNFWAHAQKTILLEMETCRLIQCRESPFACFDPDNEPSWAQLLRLSEPAAWCDLMEEADLSVPREQILLGAKKSPAWKPRRYLHNWWRQWQPHWNSRQLEVVARSVILPHLYLEEVDFDDRPPGAHSSPTNPGGR